jgi:predicted methyltransferase
MHHLRSGSLASRLTLALVLATVATAGCKRKDKTPAPTEVPRAGSVVATPPPPPPPAELLGFLQVGEGMRVAELFAGGGYTVELLARVVGPTGVVYGQNTADILEKFAEKPWSARLARLASPTIVRVDRDLGAPLPDDATNLDLVVMHLVYHDTVWLGVDRTRMNAAIWKALKPGGEFAVVDHSAKDGTGSDAAKELHRIEKRFVQAEIEQAGFKLDRASDLFAHPEDTRDWSASPRAAADQRGHSDRFALVFKKPVDAK